MGARAARAGVVLRRVETSVDFRALIARAVYEHVGDPDYLTELTTWSGRHASTAGVPARNTPEGTEQYVIFFFFFFFYVMSIYLVQLHLLDAHDLDDHSRWTGRWSTRASRSRCIRTERPFPLDLVPRVIQPQVDETGARRRPARPGAGGVPRR